MSYSIPALDPTDPLGSDIALDVNGDLIITEQGDIQILSGLDNIKQAIRIRLQTKPDSYLFGSDLGSELGSMVDEPLNPQNIRQIEQAVYNALIVDSRISSVDRVQVSDPNDGSNQFFVTVSATVIGVGSLQTTVPVGGFSSV